MGWVFTPAHVVLIMHMYLQQTWKKKKTSMAPLRQHKSLKVTAVGNIEIRLMTDGRVSSSWQWSGSLVSCKPDFDREANLSDK